MYSPTEKLFNHIVKEMVGVSHKNFTIPEGIDSVALVLELHKVHRFRSKLYVDRLTQTKQLTVTNFIKFYTGKGL